MHSAAPKQFAMGPVGFAIVGLSVVTFILGIVLIAISGYLLDIVRFCCLLHSLLFKLHSDSLRKSSSNCIPIPCGNA
jgi:hypothetical protein